MTNSNTAKLPILFAMSSLVFMACNTSDTEAPHVSSDTEAPHVSVLSVGSAVEQRAEEAAYEHLNNKNTGLLDGVQAVWTTRITHSVNGVSHTRVQQTHDNIPVFGGEAIVHTDKRGQLKRFTDNLLRDIDVDTKPVLTGFDATDLAVNATVGWERLTAEPRVDLQILRHNGQDYLTYRVELKKFRADENPSMPVVFINAHTGEEVWRYDNLQTASLSDADKQTYDMNNGTNYGNAVIGDSSDSDLNTTHNSIDQTLAFLLAEVGRDSYDGTGAIVNSYGHYSNNYVNAFWDGIRLTFGDGDGSISNYLGVLDVSAHELGHAVTTHTANLVYANESGALNEASSDILAAAVEAYVDGGISTATWNVGEDCWLQGGSDPSLGNALRFMQAPSTDGSSRDHYSNRYTGTADNGGVHWNSGIANHWFYLLTSGGQHHNAVYRSGCTISGISISNAYDIWYHALENNMTSSTDFADARTATESSCTTLGFSSAVCDAVSEAWYEVGVGSDPGCGGGGGPVCGNGVCEVGESASSCPDDCGSSSGELSNGVPVTNLSGSTGSEVFYTIDVPAGASNLSFNMSGGSGDADLYVKFGSAPTISSYDCRPYLYGNNETCTFATPNAGTYHVMIRGYSSYSGVTLVASYDEPSCTPYSDSLSNLSGSAGSESHFTQTVPACATTLTIKISGGTGDADLYVKFGSAPTTSSFDCRPYLYGNNETCTFTPPSVGDYHIMLRGYYPYSGVTLSTSYE